MIAGIIAFIFLWAVVEFFFMLFNVYDNYGENWIWSGIVTAMFIGFIALVVDIEVDVTDNAEQAAMLEEQWSEPDIAASVKIEINEQEREEIKEFFDSVTDDNYVEVEQKYAEPEVTVERVVPANRAFIDPSRRRTTTVVYDHETREACNDDGCFRAQLIQHTDGSFWACKRNYGACYEY